jgi:hypothetical protein
MNSGEKETPPGKVAARNNGEVISSPVSCKIPSAPASYSGLENPESIFHRDRRFYPSGALLGFLSPFDLSRVFWARFW